MRTLLIAYYWHPYNNSGVFRWARFSEHMDFDVLTCRRPLRSKVDPSVESGSDNVRRFGAFLPAVVWGILAPLFVLKKYDTIILTSPPESLIIAAWFLQLLGFNVVLDMRDAIDRPNQFFNRLSGVYRYFYNKIRRVVVTYQFIDESKPVIYSGYDDIKGSTFAGYYINRVRRSEYIYGLETGRVPDQSSKPSGYSSSAVQTLRHLDYPVNNKFHHEIHTHKLVSVGKATKLYKGILCGGGL